MTLSPHLFVSPASQVPHDGPEYAPLLKYKHLPRHNGPVAAGNFSGIPRPCQVDTVASCPCYAGIRGAVGSLFLLHPVRVGAAQQTPRGLGDAMPYQPELWPTTRRALA